MPPVPTESNVLYVWVPYALFLLVVFIILAFSFVKHIKRVLKRRRVLMDYIEAEVLSKRPRIGRMYSSHSEDASTFRSEWTSSVYSDRPVSRSPYINHPVLSSDVCGEAHVPHLMENDLRLSPRPVKSLRLPAVVDPSVYRYKHNGLEDSGQSMWFRDRLMYGYNNFAFSFDEDLGRSHTRRVLSSPRSPRPPGMHRREEEMPRYGYAPSMAVIESEQESQQSSPRNTNSAVSRLQPGLSVDTQSRLQSSAECPNNVQTSSSPKPAPLHDVQQLEPHLPGAEDLHPRTCSYCGSLLPATAINGTQNTGTRPKKKPKYRRQSACTETTSASDFSSKSAPEGSSKRLYNLPPQDAPDCDTRLSNSPRTLYEVAYPSSGHSATTTSSHRSGEGEVVTPGILSGRGRLWTGRRLQRSLSHRTSAEQLARGVEVFTIERSQSSEEPASAPLHGDLADQSATTTVNPLRRPPSVSLPSNSHQLSPTKSANIRTSPLSVQSFLRVSDIAEVSSSSSSPSKTAAAGTSLQDFGRSLPTTLSATVEDDKNEFLSADLVDMQCRRDSEDGSIFWLSGKSTNTKQTLV